MIELALQIVGAVALLVMAVRVMDWAHATWHWRQVQRQGGRYGFERRHLSRIHALVFVGAGVTIVVGTIAGIWIIDAILGGS